MLNRSDMTTRSHRLTIAARVFVPLAVAVACALGTSRVVEAEGAPRAPDDVAIAAGLDLAGVWRIEGRPASGGPSWQGALQLQRLEPGRYEARRVVGGEVEAGEARVRDGLLLVRTGAPASEGLTGVLGGGGLQPPGAPAAGGPRLAAYRLQRCERRMLGTSRGADGASAERLARAGDDAANNRVDLLVDGPEMFPALREALQGARRTIDLQTFIFTGDATGRSITAILCERARAGVRVRVLVDAFGDELGRDVKAELEAAGVELIVQHGVARGLLNSFADAGRGVWNGLKRLFGGDAPPPREKRGLVNHDHRKITIVDGRVGFVGGMNLAREYEHTWRDVHARVEGSAVPRMHRLFLDRWRAAGGKCEQEPVAHDADPWPGLLPVDVVHALPGLSQDIKERYLREIARASDRVLIENAYFLDDAVISALQRAVGRGVRSVVILPPDDLHDVKVVRDAFAFVQNDVVRSGIELYKFRGRMVHSKVAAFDGHTATVGSSNLDNMALARLAEVNIFVPDRGFTRTLEKRVLEPDQARSDRVAEGELGWWGNVKGGTLHFFRSFL